MRNEYGRAGRLIAGALLLALLVAACGDSGDDSAGDAATTTSKAADGGATEPTTAGSEATAIDACGLLTSAEVGAVLGGTAPEAKPANNPPVYTCSWETPEFDSVSISVVAFDRPDQALDVFEMAVDNNGYKTVSGIGDRAYESVIQDITAQKGRFEVSVDVNGSDNDMDNAKSLVAKALDRLPT